MRPERVEGYNNGEWILLDYIDYVIHVLTENNVFSMILKESGATGKK